MTISYGCGDDKLGMSNRVGNTCYGMFVRYRHLARMYASVLVIADESPIDVQLRAPKTRLIKLV